MSDSKSTTDRGNEFRDRVCRLLRSAGFSVSAEVRVSHKKVDAVAEKREFGRLKRYAIECKAYQAKVSKPQSIKIISDYAALKANKYVNEVWVITENITPDARLHIESMDGFRAFKIDELAHIFADFGPYLTHLQSTYASEGIDSFYIPIKTSSGASIEEYVHGWLSSSDNTPLAIEAGYGKGKTTFCIHLCNLMAGRSLLESTHRIPIYIPLGEIATEQSVSGLVSDALAKLPYVGNYSFDLIKELNSEGRLFWIFDGFDEMKHGLSFEQFRFNFSQLLSLHTPNSKILVLGRPTAFLSDKERAFILRGIERTRSNEEYRHPQWPEFKIFDISDWAHEQATSFLKSYFPVAIKKSSSMLSERDANVRLSTITSSDYADLVVRPVHAKMLVEIAVDTEETLANATEFHLYDRFIHTILRRELGKKGRDRKIGIDDRRRFAAEIAWWMWQYSGTRSARADQIPLQLIDNYNYDHTVYTPESLRRELVAGCFVDKNNTSTVYFSHRSFQEFLIAEYLLEAEFLDYDVGQVSPHLTFLISDFIEFRITSGEATKLTKVSLSIQGLSH